MSDATVSSRRKYRVVPTILALLVNLLLALLLLNLIGSYWSYWDIGINNSSRAITLIFLYAPVILIVFLAVFAVVAVIAKRLKMRQWQSALINVLVSALLFCSLFALEVQNTMNYPIDREGSFSDFLTQYLKSWF